MKKPAPRKLAFLMSVAGLGMSLGEAAHARVDPNDYARFMAALSMVGAVDEPGHGEAAPGAEQFAAPTFIAPLNETLAVAAAPTVDPSSDAAGAGQRRLTRAESDAAALAMVLMPTPLSATEAGSSGSGADPAAATTPASIIPAFRLRQMAVAPASVEHPNWAEIAERDFQGSVDSPSAEPLAAKASTSASTGDPAPTARPAQRPVRVSKVAAASARTTAAEPTVAEKAVANTAVAETTIFEHVVVAMPDAAAPAVAVDIDLSVDDAAPPDTHQATAPTPSSAPASPSSAVDFDLDADTVAAMNAQLEPAVAEPTATVHAAGPLVDVDVDLDLGFDPEVKRDPGIQASAPAPYEPAVDLALDLDPAAALDVNLDVPPVLDLNLEPTRISGWQRRSGLVPAPLPRLATPADGAVAHVASRPAGGSVGRTPKAVVPQADDGDDIVVASHADRVLQSLEALLGNDADGSLQGHGARPSATFAASETEKALLTLAATLRAGSGASVAHRTGSAQGPAERPTAAALGEGLVAISENTLDQVRGGFMTSTGLQVSFGIERAIYINGNLVTTTSLNVSDLGKVAGGQAAPGAVDAASMGSAANGVTLVQNGAGNTFASGPISAASLGTIVQNTLNDQKIQSVTSINATVNSLQIVRAQNFQSSLRGALIDSLRR